MMGWGARRRRIGLRLGAALCLLSVALTGVTPSAEATTPGTAVLLGSSSVGGHLGHTLLRELATVGVEVVLRRRSSTGLARPDFYDWPRSVSRGPELGGHAGVMVLLGGNDTQPIRLMRGQRRVRAVRWEHEEAWRDTYAGLVRAFGQTLCEQGARRVVWLLPPNPGRGAWSERLARVRAVQREAASAIRCAGDIPAVVIDGDAAEAPFGRDETSDGIHLNRAGASRYWARVGAAITRALGVRAGDPPEARGDAL
ncbi:MAG: DUF459 domain-containing protein [Myxococcales bacterium]|nr:DUF459 domain-containing protein [Myxococcales bacterium]MCB9628887.1 DUF459 domain-containing protein [Sandaracinaceae bacterium]